MKLKNLKEHQSRIVEVINDPDFLENLKTLQEKKDLLEDKGNSIVNALSQNKINLSFKENESNIYKIFCNYEFNIDNKNTFIMEQNNGKIMNYFSFRNSLHFQNDVTINIRENTINAWIPAEELYSREITENVNGRYIQVLIDLIRKDFYIQINKELKHLLKPDLHLNVQRLNQFINKNKLYNKKNKNGIEKLAINNEFIDLHNFQEYEEILCLKYDYEKGVLPKRLQKKLGLK